MAGSCTRYRLPSLPSLMTALAVVSATNPRVLLETAADGFLSTVHRPSFTAQPFSSPDYLLALRQGQIREDLYRLAAEQDKIGRAHV